jgi:hypothetical protein
LSFPWTYRDDGEAWLERRAHLVRAALADGDLVSREARIADLELLDRARRRNARRHLPVLARAPKASPCGEAFEAMTGDAGVRSCTRCDREVFDPARLTLGRIQALVGSRAVCERADGTMMFGDCESAAHRMRVRRVGIAIAALALTGVAVALSTMPIEIHRIASLGGGGRRE